MNYDSGALMSTVRSPHGLNDSRGGGAAPLAAAQFVDVGGIPQSWLAVNLATLTRYLLA